MKGNYTITIHLAVRGATRKHIDEFVYAALVQTEDIEDADGEYLGDLPVVGTPKVIVKRIKGDKK